MYIVCAYYTHSVVCHMTKKLSWNKKTDHVCFLNRNSKKITGMIIKFGKITDNRQCEEQE